MGTKETEDLLIFVTRLANSIDKTLADGKVGVTDVQYLFDPLLAAKAAFEGVNSLDDELADLSDAEASALVDLVARELDLTNDASEELAEEGLALMVNLVRFVNKIRAARA